jgi:ubiquitin-conjugating enzyme E2 M
MLSLKKKKKEEQEAAAKAAEESGNGGGGGAGPLSLLGIGGVRTRNSGATVVKKKTPGELRCQNDIANLDTGDAATVKFPKENDLTNFELYVTPDTGYWKGATYKFTFDIPSDYPHKPPKVLCKTKIYHPNIDLEGNVCLNILREEWKPVLELNSVIFGVIYLFYEPNANDPLNKEAADLLRNDSQGFSRTVKKTLEGKSHNGESFPKLK